MVTAIFVMIWDCLRAEPAGWAKALGPESAPEVLWSVLQFPYNLPCPQQLGLHCL